MKRKQYIVIDVRRSTMYGLNPTQSILAACLYGLLSTTPIQFNGNTCYLADYQYVANYCPILPQKTDTIRRMYKELSDKGLINVIKINKHVYFIPSNDLREWSLECETEKNPQCVEIPQEDINEAENNPITTEKNPQLAEKNPLTPYNKYNNNYNNNINEVSITSNAMSEQSSAAPVEKETIDFPMLIKFFNDTMDEHNCVIPRVKTISGTRKTAVNARLREHGKDAIMQVIIKASVSNFMNGANNHDWTATFDWMFKPNNFPKILEGNYDNKTTTDKGYISDSERAREQRYKEYEGVIAQFEEEQRQIENGTYPFSD